MKRNRHAFSIPAARILVHHYCPQCGRVQLHVVVISGRQEIYTCTVCNYQQPYTVK